MVGDMVVGWQGGMAVGHMAVKENGLQNFRAFEKI